MVWVRRPSWPSSDLPNPTRSAVFPVAAAAPQIDQIPPLAKIGPSSRSKVVHITPWVPSLTGQPAPHAQKRHVQDSVFATMSRPVPQPQAQAQAQPRASPLIPRPVPAAQPPPRTKSFALPNALSRVGTPVPKGTWILGREDDTEGNGYVRTIKPGVLCA